MPLHDVGYRKWEGRRTSHLTRTLSIAETGIRLASKSSWVKRMVLFAWLPVVWWGVAFFAYERAIERSGAGTRSGGSREAVVAPAIQRDAMERIAENYRIPQVNRLFEKLDRGDIEGGRNIFWSWLMMTFFRYPQALLILFLIGATVPPLISRDIRSRAFLIYFSRPIGRLEYIFGKLLVPIGFIIFVTTLPALGLYLFAIGMSPNLDVIWSTWDIPLKILTATLALVIPTSLLALMLSSLTQEAKFVSFAWFAIWTLGHGAWLAVQFTTAIRLSQPPFSRLVMSDPTVTKWSVLSLYNNLGNIQSWIFGFHSLADVWPGVVTLVVISVVSSIILYRRVSAPIRV